MTNATRNIMESRFSITIEPVNLCNLACSYCVRDDGHLHKDPAAYLSVDLLARALRDAKELCGGESVSIGGGEPTLHPRFEEILGVIANEGYRFGLVTNGWHFGRVRSALEKHRSALRIVAFSLDGDTEGSHDAIRGKGSFRRLTGAVADCHALGFPFGFKVVLHKANAKRVEALGLFAARLGAESITFAHFLPTSPEVEREMGLTAAERAEVEREIGVMGRILRLEVAFAAGYANTDPSPPCRVLALKECNIDYAGRMSVCCNLSGFRGGLAARDMVADLNVTSFAEAWARVAALVSIQNEKRHAAIKSAGATPGFRVTSPCELCLTHFDKTPWRSAVELPAGDRA